MRTTTLTLNPEIGMQTRQHMRNVALISASLCDSDVVARDISPESVEMSRVTATKRSPRNVVQVRIFRWRDL